MVVSSIFAARENALSALPMTKGARDMLSTPPAIISDVSPLLIARAAIADGIHARTAQAIDGRARHLDREPGQQQRHAPDVAVVLARLVGAAVDHVIDGGPVHPGVALDQRADAGSPPGRRAHVRERAAVAADGRPDGVADEGIGHGGPGSLRPAAMGAGVGVVASVGRQAIASGTPVSSVRSGSESPSTISSTREALRGHVDARPGRCRSGSTQRDAGQRIRALGDDLALAVLGPVFHHHEDVLGADGQVHGAAHGRNRIRRAGVPVGEVAAASRPGTRPARRCRDARRASSQTNRRDGNRRRRSAASPAACRR